MNSRERVLAAFHGKPLDRRAVSLVLSLYGARLTQCELPEYYTNPTAYARGQSAVREIFQPDFLFGPFSTPLEGKAFGSQVRFFEDQAPNLTRPVICSSEEINKFVIPDIDSHPTLTYFRESIRLMKKEHGTEVPVTAVLLDPVSLPVMIMGMDGWLSTLLFDQDGTRRIFDITIPYFVRWANALLADGADFIMIPSSVANPTIISREIAEEVAIPALKDSFLQINGPIVMHSGGAPLIPFIDLLSTLPNVVGFVVNGGEDLEKARNSAGDERLLVGNIDGPTLHTRSLEEIQSECIKILNNRQNDLSFIMCTSAADVSYYTPREKIHAFCKTVKS